MRIQISAVGLHAWILCQTIRGAAQSNPVIPRSFLSEESSSSNALYKNKKLKSSLSQKLEFSTHCLRIVSHLWSSGLFRLATAHLDANVFVTARTPRICDTNMKLVIEVFRYIIQVWKAKEEKAQDRKRPSEICSALSDSIISKNTSSDLISSDLRMNSEGTFLSADGLLKWTCILAHMHSSLNANNIPSPILHSLQNATFELLEGLKEEESR